MKVVIINYNIGNLRSIYNKIKKLNVNCKISSSKKDIINADKLILPGVGHFKKGIENLEQLNLIEILNEKVLEQRTPILGICLGMQLFAKFSEEGNVRGLGWINGDVIRFKVSDKIKYKIPHIGWNTINIIKSNYLNKGLHNGDFFYFVHSYHMHCYEKEDIWLTSYYNYEFVAGIKRDNIFGTQFHPEKSHDNGLKLLKNFIELKIKNV